MSEQSPSEVAPVTFREILHLRLLTETDFPWGANEAIDRNRLAQERQAKSPVSCELAADCQTYSQMLHARAANIVLERQIVMPPITSDIASVA